MGSSGGGYNSTTTGAPWEGQSKYLNPLFNTAFYGVTGREKDEEGHFKDTGINQVYEDFFSNDPEIKAPGKLEYFGTTGNNGRGWWQDRAYPIVNLTNAQNQGGEDIGAPTIAKFTDEQIAAQDATKSLAESRIGNQNSLLGKSETGLGNIISGGNKIPYYDIATPQINDPGEISGQKINYNPNMQAANLNYTNWNDLNTISGGSGGNKYLDDMVTAATRGINRNFVNNVIPNINSAAEDAGARGSDTWEDLRTAANQDYLTSVGDVEANIRGNAFNNQLNAQMQALGLSGNLAGKSADYTQEANRLNTDLGLQKATTEAGYGQEANTQNVMNDLQRYFEQAGITSDINKQNALLKTQTDTQNIQNVLNSIFGAPDINQAGYDDIANLSASGAEQQQMNQDVLNAYIQQFEQGQLEPWNRASLLSQLVGGNFGGTVTQSAQQKGGK